MKNKLKKLILRNTAGAYCICEDCAKACPNGCGCGHDK